MMRTQNSTNQLNYTAGLGAVANALLWLLGWTATIGFFLLYPGFFLYHYAIGQGWIEPMFMGLYGPVTLLILVVSIIPLAMTLPTFWGDARNFGIITMFFALMLYAALWVGIFGFSANSGTIVEAVNNQHFALLTSWYSLFVVGFFLNVRSVNFIRLCWAFWAIETLIVLFAFDVGTLMFRAGDGNSEYMSTYQGFARSYFFLSILLISTIRNRYGLWAFWVLSLVGLFLIGARSELATFVVMTVVIFIVSQRGHPVRTAAMLVPVALFAGIVSKMGDLIASSRQSHLLNVKADNSWSERGDLSRFAWSQITESPFVGLYGGHLQAGGFGNEAHNALSAWVSFGLVGFLFYMTLIAIAFYVSFRWYVRFPRQPEVMFAMMVCASSAFMVLFAKSVFWAEPALGWGLAASLMLPRPFGRAPRQLASGSAKRRPAQRLQRV